MRMYHNYLFLFGFIYYLISPIIVGSLGLLEEFPGMDLFYGNFLNRDSYSKYFLLCFLLFASFYFGSFSALKFRKKINYIQPQFPNIDIKLWFIILLFVFNHYYILLNRSILFTGYTLEYSTDFLGKIATFNNVYLFLFMYSRITRKYRKLLLVLLIENSIILIGMGSRMFVLIPVVAILIYVFENYHIRKNTLYLIFFLCVLFFLGVGVIRDNSFVSLEAFIYIGLAEPLFTWISASTFIDNNDIKLIGVPLNFIGTFINFIPSILLPNKAEYILPIPYNFETPLGACSIITSLYGNFGLIFTPAIVYIGGFLLTVIRYKRSAFFKTYYYCCCGVIPFLMFRDVQSMNKLIFSVFLIYPAVAIYIRLFPKVVVISKRLYKV